MQKLLWEKNVYKHVSVVAWFYFMFLLFVIEEKYFKHNKHNKWQNASACRQLLACLCSSQYSMTSVGHGFAYSAQVTGPVLLK